LVTALVALITGTAGTFAAWISDWVSFHKPSAQAERASTTTATAATTTTVPKAVQITINQPNGPVRRCAIITGTATPSGKASIWLAENAAEDHDYYGEVTKAVPDPSRPDGWRATLQVGHETETGKQFTVYAFLLDDEATWVLEHLRTAAERDVFSFYYLNQLPAPFASVPVQRNDGRNEGDTAAC
jgi:hypothetical protein